MSGLDLFERETAERINRLTPIERPETGTWDGFLRGTGMATMRTFAKAGRAIDMAGAAFPIAYDVITGGTSAQEQYFREHDEVFGTAVDRWTPKPGEVGAAGEITGQLLGTLPLVIAAPALAIGSAQLGTAEDLVLKGVDPVKAQLVGGVQGAGLGLGIYMPIFGRSLWERMLVGGAGFNVVQGAAMRGAGELILKGTPAEGEFKAFDAEALTLDLLLGAGFGVISHISPRQRAEGAKAWEKLREWGVGLKTEDRDALAVLRQVQHSNVDSLPGKPREAIDLNAHVDRVKTALDQVARDERVEVFDLPAARVDPDGARWIESERRARTIVKESEALAKAYDIVIGDPLGSVNSPLVRLTPEAIGDVLVERGPAFQRQGEAEINVGGYGLVKFIWKHGEKSPKAKEFQVTREDVLRTPEVLRDYKPIEDRGTSDGERYTEWQVPRADGKKLIYAIRRFTEGDGEQHLVTLFVNEEKTAKFRNKAMSEKTNRLESESPTGGSKPRVGDTAPDSSSSPPGGREGGSGESITEPAGPSASRDAGTPPSGSGEQARPAASDKVDPLAAEAERIAAAHPDLQVTVGVDEAGEPIRKTAKQLLEDAKGERAKTAEDLKLLQVAAECMLGVG